ncbi:hypothetical protein F9C28_13975 [Shimwellia pseudoproteus]|uniref:hypothetical protein n=1 Tax=Shimwellia pseudoproteus TaxID=570012 RepID=UPI0018ED32BE|nr:hypothetical protein [Shimwellia pseudoproteus]MBJ3816009.1 hypothetical protein [Shimwellia pseudoproteus]
MSAPTISISVELMKNYKQTLLMSPEKDFEALQTNNGHSLFFSIGTDNVFYLTSEAPGHDTGWEKNDLSSKQIAASFPGQQNMACKRFAVGQSVVDGTIGLALVISDGHYDHLFLSVGNASGDTDWRQSPVWVHYPFDNPAKDVVIEGVFISETANNTQFIVVDILRDPASDEPLISRYYIDQQHTPAWQPHDVAIDLEANRYTSCLGRQYLPNSPHQPTIDGLYTCGQVDGAAQLIFQPLYNVFNPAIPAAVARLQLPGNTIADCLASCRNSNLSSDLYVCGGGGLYYFASANQADSATGVLLMQNSLFNGVRKMYAAQSNQRTVVWGLNSNNQIFYVSCPQGQEAATPPAWSYPLPIVTGVDLFSPYLNQIDDGNTFFAVAGGTLQKWIKSTDSTLWNAQYITLPSPDTTDTQQYSSYTTRIQLTDDSNQPLSHLPVVISAPGRTGVYINHLYYVIDATGVEVCSDDLGSITVIEWVNSLTGTRLSVRDASGNTAAVDPMAKPMAKLAQLNSVSGLRSAVITGDDGTTTPLVSSSVSDADLQAVATANGQLGTVYHSLAARSVGQPQRLLATPVPSALRVAGIDAIIVDLGDLVSWLASGVEAIIQIVKDAATGVWNFVARIAGSVYSAVLDVAEKVVAAAEWIFTTIKTAIKDLILFLEFLLNFNDVLVTHRVMKNVYIQLVKHSIASIADLKADVISTFTTLQNDVNKWADIPGFAQTPKSTGAASPPLSGQNSAPAQLGIHHFQGNMSNAAATVNAPAVTTALFDDLVNFLNNEGETFSAACGAIKTDIIDNFDNLSVTQIIQKFTAIVADTLLQTTENILCAVIDVFTQLAGGFLDLLTTTIDIPVISWLYKKLTGDDLSCLDLFCFIAAIPATLVYKIINGKTPFSTGDGFTDGLLAAQNFDQVRSQFFTGTISSARGELMLAATAPVLDDNRLKVFGFASGFFALAGSVGLIVITAIQRVLDLIPGDILLAGRIRMLALAGAVANIAYVSPNIATLINAKTATWWQQMNNALTGISILKGFANIALSSQSSTQVLPRVSAFVESTINIAWNVPVILNIINNKSKWNTTYKSLIPESIANFSFNLGGTLEFPIAMTQDIKVKAIECAVQYAFMLTYGGLIVVAGSINEATN